MDPSTDTATLIKMPPSSPPPSRNESLCCHRSCSCAHTCGDNGVINSPGAIIVEPRSSSESPGAPDVAAFDQQHDQPAGVALRTTCVLGVEQMKSLPPHGMHIRFNAVE